MRLPSPGRVQGVQFEDALTRLMLLVQNLKQQGFDVTSIIGGAA